jgi:ATP-dependent Clp protease ATP-binding subunit ClpA
MENMDRSHPWRTPRLNQVLADAADIAADAGHRRIGVEHVVLSVLRDPDALPTQELKKLGVDVAELDRRLSATMRGEPYRTPTNRVRDLDGNIHEPK